MWKMKKKWKCFSCYHVISYPGNYRAWQFFLYRCNHFVRVMDHKISNDVVIVTTITLPYPCCIFPYNRIYWQTFLISPTFFWYFYDSDFLFLYCKIYFLFAISQQDLFIWLSTCENESFWVGRRNLLSYKIDYMKSISSCVVSTSTINVVVLRRWTISYRI